MWANLYKLFEGINLQMSKEELPSTDKITHHQNE